MSLAALSYDQKLTDLLEADIPKPITRVPIRIEKGEMLATFVADTEDGDAAGARRRPMSVNLRDQGFKVFFRAFFRMNRGLYVPGGSIIPIDND